MFMLTNRDTQIAYGAHLGGFLTGLAIAQAGSGREQRRYDMTVPDRDEGGRTTAHLFRDREPILDWDVDAQTILDPEPFPRQALGRGFLARANRRFDPETAEVIGDGSPRGVAGTPVSTARSIHRSTHVCCHCRNATTTRVRP